MLRRWGLRLGVLYGWDLFLSRNAVFPAGLAASRLAVRVTG